jgi:hypothetical protein
MTALISTGFIWLTAALTTISGVQYLYQGSKLLNVPSDKEPRDTSLVH